MRSALLLLLPLGALASPADLIILAETVITQDAEQPRAAALAVRHGRLVFVGSAAAAMAHKGPETRVLKTKVVVPGLVDAHGHLTGLGKSLDTLGLVGTTSAQAVADLAAKAEGSGWVEGRGWDQNDWADKAFPTHALLSAAQPTRPVALRRVDGHALWVNAAAMKAAGISAKTPDPKDGKIHRDPSGAPTGVFVDGAMSLIYAAKPKASRAQVKRWAQMGVKRCHEVGLTGVHDAGASEQNVEIYRELAAAGQLGLRVHVMLDGDEKGTLLHRAPRRGDFVSVLGVKLFADGALGSRGAWLKAPYADAPETRGIPILHGEALRSAVRRHLKAGFQLGVHAIGDAAAAEVLAAYEAAGVKPAHRFRLEHAQVVSPAQREQMARMGIIASMQPTHATSDMPWAPDRLGPERTPHSYAWRSLKKAGVRLALGSDFPVERPNPLEGLYAAVSRRDRQGNPAKGWRMDEALSPAEALAGFTTDAAYAGFEEQRRGRIEVGMDADLTLLGADPLKVEPARLKDIRVLGTVVAGRVVYEAK